MSLAPKHSSAGASQNYFSKDVPAPAAGTVKETEICGCLDSSKLSALSADSLYCSAPSLSLLAGHRR